MAMKQIPFVSVPNLPALEGYLAVRWVANILAAMPSINRTLFMDAVYDRKMFWMDDVTIGLMTDLSCFCNAGLSVLRIVQIHNATGLPTLDTHDDTINTMTYPLSQCFLTSNQLRTPISFGLWQPLIQSWSAKR